MTAGVDAHVSEHDRARWHMVKRQLRQHLIRLPNFEALVTPPATGNGYRTHAEHEQLAQKKLRDAILGTLKDELRVMVATADQDQLVEEITSELIGYGPIAPFMEDDSISEVMINGPGKVFIERAGRIHATDVRFRNAEHLRYCIERMLNPLRVFVNESQPFVDAMLADGSRLNVVIPPLVIEGPVVTIRKQLPTFAVPQLVSFGMMTDAVAAFLRACIAAHINIVISGGTSTGKTTLVTALSTYLSPGERVITIENVSELQLAHPEHWIRLITRPPNADGRGEITIRQLVKNALRMRPDRIILGEARGAEALDMMQAMHTGHEGLITIVHGTSPEAALGRLETMMLMSDVDLPPQACRMQIASVLELLIHVTRFPDGARRISRISQLSHVTDREFALEDLFVFQIDRVESDGAIAGGLCPTGATPNFYDKFKSHNVLIESWIRSKGA